MERTRQFSRAHDGFTLVELLVVMGTLGILMAALIPAVTRARQSSAQLACTSNLHQWATAALMYAQQEQGWLPRRGQGAQPTFKIDRPTDWFNALPPLIRLKPYVDLVAENKVPRPGDGSVWMCPAAVDGGQKYFFAYGMNMGLSTWSTKNPDRINRISPTGNLVFMADGPGAYCALLPSSSSYSPAARHAGRVNISFLDGHVSSFPGKDVGCGVGDPKRSDVQWIIPGSQWTGPGSS